MSAATSVPISLRMESRSRRSEPAADPRPRVSTEPGPARLLAGLPARGQWRSLARHRAQYGQLPAPGTRPNGRLMEVIERSGLTGRGGGGFPTARKLRAVAAGRGERVVVVNATEGEPLSAKDALLIAAQPHLVLDGALLAAHAVAASRIYVCVDRRHRESAAALRRSLAERAGREAVGCDVRIVDTPPRYVSGEETALVHFLNNGPAKPTLAPPRPSERGVDRCPTLVQNVETLAHLAQVASFGSDWFRQAGTAAEPGTALFTVTGESGPVVLEAGLGSLGGDVLAAAGVLGAAGAPPAGVALVGGFFGTWVPTAELARTQLSRDGLAPLGAGTGAGVLALLPAGTCGLLETARLLRWYAGESAGQCGPCAFGLPALAGTAAEIAAGRARGEDAARLWRWANEIEGRGGCRHPDGAVRLVRSAFAVFRPDLEDHLAGRPCEGSHHPVLRVPASSREWR